MQLALSPRGSQHALHQSEPSGRTPSHIVANQLHCYCTDVNVNGHPTLVPTLLGFPALWWILDCQLTGPLPTMAGVGYIKAGAGYSCQSIFSVPIATECTSKVHLIISVPLFTFPFPYFLGFSQRSVTTLGLLLNSHSQSGMLAELKDHTRILVPIQ
jgi:hypothetical protein